MAQNWLRRAVGEVGMQERHFHEPCSSSLLSLNGCQKSIPGLTLSRIYLGLFAEDAGMPPCAEWIHAAGVCSSIGVDNRRGCHSRLKPALKPGRPGQ
jgi:hypothetical protein